MNNDLIQKLMISKKIMDRHSSIPRSGNGIQNSNYGNDNYREQNRVETFEPAQGNYNIPQEFLSEASLPKKQTNLESSKDMVINSKLPDEIKRLMLEHPIQKPQTPEVTISNDIVEAAARLMNIRPNGDPIAEKQTTKKTSQQTYSQPRIPTESPDLKKMIKESVREILQENGLLIEGVQKSDDLFSFRVGQHIFEGKVTKIKKIK